MRRVIVLASMLAVSGAALAEPAATTCFNPHRSYSAHSLNRHEVFVQTTMGKPRPPVRLTTSCINLEPAIGFGFSASFICVGMGDAVVASTADGRREQCVVTRVAPYAPATGDMHG